MSSIKWKLLEIINNTECVVDLNRHLEKIGLNKEFNSENITIFNYEEDIPQDDITLLENSIKKEIIDNEQTSRELDEDDFLNVKLYECEEIIFSCCIQEECKSEEDLLNFLSTIGIVSEYDLESNHFDRYEYSSMPKYPLFHNVRAKNIAIFHFNSLECGMAFIGYMYKDDVMYLNIKTFQYDVLHFIMDNLKKRYKNIVQRDNLSWKWILSRKIPTTGYRPTESYLVEHPLSQQFLKTSKSSESAGNFQFILNKILDKGYLDENEYSKVSVDKNVSKFLHQYTICEKTNLERIWIGQATGMVYKELDKADPKRVEPLLNLKKVYSPHHDLLYYIRAFWHQNFVEDALLKVKEKWDENDNSLKILDIVIDTKFDFISETKPSRMSRDIDCLLRLKNIINNEEYIVSIECKRNSKELSEVIKDNQKKISSTYAKVFSSFLMISYLKNGEPKKQDTIVWEKSNIEKDLFICVEHNFNDLVENITNTLNNSCGIEKVNN